MHLAFRRLTLPAVVALVCLLAAVPAFAQNNASHEDNGIGIGANFGFVSNSVHGTDLVGAYNSRAGSLFGIWVGGNMNGLIGFTGEFNYVQLGFTDPNGNNFKNGVFEIPAVFHVNFGQRVRNGVHAFALFGPSFDLTLSQSENGNDLTGNDKFKGAGVGIMAGGGIEAYRFGVQIRGNWGLKSIAPNGTVSDVKNRTIQVVGTFRFN